MVRITGRVSLQGNEISRQALVASFGAGAGSDPAKISGLTLG